MSTQTLLADWRVQAAIFLFSDSSAARAAMQGERTRRKVETCSDTTLVVAGTRSHGARGDGMRCWS